MAVNAPAALDFTFYKGAAFKYRIALTNKDNTPRSLTGYTAKMMIRQDVDDAAAALTLTSPSSGLTVDNANGYIDILVTKTQTAAFVIPSGVWDLWIDNGGTDSPELIVGGGVTIRKAVTQ